MKEKNVLVMDWSTGSWWLSAGFYTALTMKDVVRCARAYQMEEVKAYYIT